MSKMYDKTTDTFSFFLPVDITKSDEAVNESDKDKRIVAGLASTDSMDLQGEVVVQTGIDFGYFMKHGLLNDNHTDKVVGEPVECKITPKGFWLKGMLYKENDRADYYWNLMRSMAASGASRKVGFSIEGKVLRRNGNKIQKCWIKNIALTSSPVNTDTWAEIIKSFNGEKFCSEPWAKSCSCCESPVSCDTKEEHKDDCLCKKPDGEKALSAGGMGGSLVPQSLEGKNKVQIYKNYGKIDELNFDDAILYLQLEKGYSRNSAEAIADAIFTNYKLR